MKNPELQPIEMFWAAGKNHVDLKYHNGFKMKEVVRYLRDGWYGNGEEFLAGHPYRKRPVDCRKLWKTCVNVAGTKFVPLYGGILGMIGDLVVDETWVDEEVTLPIDTMVVDLTSALEEDSD